jgi:hypothetical protein
MKKPFYEDYSNEEDADPLDAHANTPFNWSKLYQELGEELDGYELEPEQMEKLAYAFKQIFQWIVDFKIESPAAEKMIARRVISVAWTLAPDMFDGSPSLTKLAAKLGIEGRNRGYDKMILSVHTSEFSEKFSFQNRAQSHGGKQHNRRAA